jgi:outer membrane protein OmpA-like peptidoglycan-associated protein
MKKLSLFVLSCCTFATIFSQNIVKEHYTASGGLLGAANFSQFRVTGNNPLNIDYNFEGGWSGGAWVNFPMSQGFSIEPQLMYSSYGYHSNNASLTALLGDGKIRYISVPLILKFHTGDKFAITAGPQLDWFSSFEDKNNRAQEDDFKKTSFSAFGGFEILPHGRVTVFGRYIFGISNMDNSGTHGDEMKYKNQNIQAGLKLKLFGKKVEADSDGDGVIDKNDKCPNVAGLERYNGCPIPDTDGDGINDEQDKCPNEKGTAKYNGCPIPDTDKDGINDEEDKCPNEAGLAKYNGCPIPDTDKDGINDEEDKCPSEAGPASNNGCPIADRDKDGINDDEDKCPDVPGIAKNFGCPDAPQVPAEVSKALAAAGQSIYFSSNSAKLAAAATASLNKIVKVMKDNPQLKIKIEGNTDNVEKNADNLSEGRANAVKTYLVSKGISADRIEVEGAGSTMPIGDNNTTAGRNKNRRVEIKATY